MWTEDQIRPVLQMKMKACVDCHQTNRAKVTAPCVTNSAKQG